MGSVLRLLAALFASATLVFGIQSRALAEGQNYLLATASTGGTYYPVGVALATLTKVKIQPKHKSSISAINSAGSAENVKLLRDDEAQFAILQGLYGSYAWNGSGPLEKQGRQEYLRSVTMLWQNVEQFVVRTEHARTGTVSDILAMKGMRMALGKKNSGTIGSNRKILANLGIDIDRHFDLYYAGYGPSAEALQNGRVEGINTPAGIPTGAVTKLFASAGGEVRPLAFTDEQVAKADGGLGLWTRFVIPAGTYPGQGKDWNTIAQPNFLAVRADVSEEFVYLLTKTVYENLPFLRAIHKATNAMSLAGALAGLPAPLHPGAARYYKEAGMEIPAHLIAE